MKWTEIKKTIENKGVNDDTDIHLIIVEFDDRRVNIDLNTDENSAVIFGS